MKRKDFNEDFEVLLRRHLGSRSSGLENAQDCPDENAMIAYLEGQLPPELKVSLERHASHCNRCQEELTVLLQTGMPLAENPGALSLSTKVSGILSEMAAMLRSFQVWGFRPALAMLLIAVIGSYIGYELYLQKSHPSQPELDERLTRSKEALPREIPPSAELPNEVAQSPGEVPSSKPAERPSSPAIAASQSRSGAAAQSASAKRIGQTAKSSEIANSIPPEAPASSPRVSENEKDTTTEMNVLNREESPKQVFAPAIASEALAQKEAPQNAADSLKSGDFSTATRNLATTEKSAIPVSPAGARPMKSDSLVARTSEPGTSVQAKRTEVTGVPVGLGKKAKGTLVPMAGRQDAREAPALPDGSRLEAGGKVFVLRDQVWTDLSILHSSTYSQVFIRRNSDNFSELVKPLADYLKVISRPEDVLVLHEGRVYWISSRSEPSENH